MTTYHIAQAMMGHAIVMTDDEGNRITIQVGIKSYDSAVKIRDRWIKREAAARAKAEKSAALLADSLLWT